MAFGQATMTRVVLVVQLGGYAVLVCVLMVVQVGWVTRAAAAATARPHVSHSHRTPTVSLTHYTTHENRLYQTYVSTHILAFDAYLFTKVYTSLDITYGIILLLWWLWNTCVYYAEGLQMKPDGGLRNDMCF